MRCERCIGSARTHSGTQARRLGLEPRIHMQNATLYPNSVGTTCHTCTRLRLPKFAQAPVPGSPFLPSDERAASVLPVLARSPTRFPSVTPRPLLADASGVSSCAAASPLGGGGGRGGGYGGGTGGSTGRYGLLGARRGEGVGGRGGGSRGGVGRSRRSWGSCCAPRWAVAPAAVLLAYRLLRHSEGTPSPHSLAGRGARTFQRRLADVEFFWECLVLCERVLW